MKQRHFITILISILPFIAFSQNPGDSVFFSPNIHTIKFYFSQTGWWDSLVAYKPLDIKMLADVEIDGNYIDSVGIQFKGNASYDPDSLKNSFKIDFNEFVSGQKYDQLKTLNLNNGASDPTMLREKIFLDFCLAVGIEAPRATYTNLYINDTLWGFYTLVEQVNKTFLQTEYGNDGGNLFKGDPNGTLEWFGSNQTSYYNYYELKTNKTANDWTDLVHLIDEINNTPSVNFYDSLENVLNTTEWMEAWAANNVFVNLDSYMGSGHNHYFYHNTATNKFDPIIWDVNGCFGGNKHMGMTTAQIKDLSIFFIPNPSSGRPLNNRMLQNSVYTGNYIYTVCNYATNYFTHVYLDTIIDSLANLIRPYVYADTNKFFTNQQFEDNITIDVPAGFDTIPGLKSFITKRRNSLTAELAAYGCYLGVNEISEIPFLNIYPNPASNSLTISLSEKLNAVLKITDVFGREVLSSAINDSQITIQIDLPNGFYFLSVTSNNFSITNKIEIIK